MATTQELESYFNKMANGEFHPDAANLVHVKKTKTSSAPRMGRSRYTKAMYKVSNMVGGGPVTVSPVQQGIEQAKQMTRLKRGRSGSRSQSSSRKRRKSSSKKSKTSSTTLTGQKKKKKKKAAIGKKKKKTSTKRKGKKKRRTILDY